MKQLTAQKSVNYHGINVIVPANTRWLATDSDGYLGIYTDQYCEPTLKNRVWDNGYEYIFICQVDLEGMDWKDSLMEVK